MKFKKMIFKYLLVLSPTKARVSTAHLSKKFLGDL